MDTHRDVRVLIAEDNPLFSKTIHRMLEGMGYTVAGIATDGLDAIDLTLSLQPDVILMDVGMPNMDGIQATQHIQARCPTPVVVLTAYEPPDLLEQASAAGVGAYLVKPPKAPEIERAITIAMARFADMIQLRQLNAELQARNQELQEALTKVKTLSGLLPICASCKKIRDDQGYWQQVEEYIQKHSEAEFTHGICPDCVKKLYPELYGDKQQVNR
jgi:AmiR/NasT family two-component response regulator